MFVRKSNGFVYPHHNDLREAMGLPRKLPATGMEPQLVRCGGRMVWFYLVPQRPLKPRERRRMEHRMFAICPSCHRHVPASRLAQHEGTESCYNTYDALSRSGSGREEDLDRELYNAREFAVKKDWSGFWWSERDKCWYAPGVIPNEE
jgi:hypothetical protein